MRFRGFRISRVIDPTKFITSEIGPCLKDLFAGLKNLDLIDNFDSFEETLELSSGQEAIITNRLKRPPSKRVIVRQVGNGVISDGNKSWNSSQVSLKNEGPDRVKITVIFMR